jgi:hypothetical protein
MLTKKRTYNEIDARILEDALRERFPELDPWEVRKPRYVGEEKYHPVDENGNIHIQHKWSLIAEQEWHNDSSYTLEIREYDEEDGDENDEYSNAWMWAEYKRGERQWIPLEFLLSILAKEGKLPYGDLLIKVCW